MSKPMKLTAAQRKELVAKHMQTAAGREILAASMEQPLREFRDYSGVIRRALEVDELAQGDIPYYDKDVNTPAFVVAEEGNDVMAVIKPARVTVPLREIAANPTIPFTQMRQRRYDVNKRVKEKVQSEIIREEDKLGFNLFSKVANSASLAANDPILVASRNALSIDDFSEAQAYIESWGDVKAANIFMNPVNMVAMRRINKDYYIDFETSKELMKVGSMGNLYGMSINTSSVISPKEIFVTGEPEFLGRLVVAQDLTVMNADDTRKREYGFSVFEQVGFLLHNPKALVLIKIAG